MNFKKVYNLVNYDSRFFFLFFSSLFFFFLGGGALLSETNFFEVGFLFNGPLFLHLCILVFQFLYSADTFLCALLLLSASCDSPTHAFKLL